MECRLEGVVLNYPNENEDIDTEEEKACNPNKEKGVVALKLQVIGRSKPQALHKKGRLTIIIILRIFDEVDGMFQYKKD